MCGKRLFLVLCILVTAFGELAWAELFDPPLQNPSFELADMSPGGGNWGYNADDWILNSYGSAYLENGSYFPASDGTNVFKLWNGAYIWQQIGTWDQNTDYNISMWVGRGFASSAMQVELWAGGNPAALPTSTYGEIDATVGATLVSGDTLTPSVSVGENEWMTLTLNTGTGFAPGAALWLKIESISVANEATWVDNVTVERATDPALASNPHPANGAENISRDATLSWTPGQDAVAHEVYFGTSFDDVNMATRSNPLDVLVGEEQTAETFELSNLQYGQTYYWRIDEISANQTYGGTIWSFTVEPYLYQIEDVNVSSSMTNIERQLPANLINGSGLADGLHSAKEADMWVGSVVEGEPAWLQFDFDRDYKVENVHIWNYNYHLEQYIGLGVNDVTVEYTQDGVEWTTAGSFQVPQAPGAPDYAGVQIDLGGIAARAIRLIFLSNRGNNLAQYGLSEIRFNYFPTFSRYPDPVDGATAVDVASLLNWRPGRDATEFKVNLGTDPNAVADGLAEAATVQAASYNPGMLSLGTEYFWRIDDVNAAQTPATWMSDIWSFSTPPYEVVDDFESYTDEPGEEVFVVWPDGYGISGNGSQVTYDNPPYMETTIVHSGGQSMPYHYGKNSATNSEATMDVGGANWTLGNAKTLVLYFRGDLDNDPAQLYVKIGTTRINYPGEPGGLAAPLWKQWNIDLASVSASRVTSFTIGVDGPGEGVLYIDDIRLYNEAPAMLDPAVDPGTANLKAYYPMNNSIADASGNGLAGAAEAGVGFSNGPAGYGQAMTVDGTDTAYATIPVGPLVQASDSMTVTAWVSRTVSANNSRVFDFGNDTDVYMFLSPASGDIRFAITTGSYDNESQVASDDPLPADGSWHHVAIVIDGDAAELSLYVDGALADTAATETLPSDLGNTANNWISRSQWTADPYLTGAIDELRIYDRALSDAEVRYLVGDR